MKMSSEQIKNMRLVIERIANHLENGIIPFWESRAEDREYGGYHTNFDGEGRRKNAEFKYLNTQARLVWWFSRLARVYPDRAINAELANKGVDFLAQHFWDENFGGFYWKTKRDGSSPDEGKVVYGESFAIYAMAEYYMATGDRRGLDYAENTFGLLQKHCADTRYGGYYENMERDWTLSKPGFEGGDRKTLDTHMHLMESFTALCEASGSELHRRKLLEIIGLISDRMVDRENRCGLNQFDLAWNPVPALAIRRTFNAERDGERPADPMETTSFGHNTELVWLMHLALKTAKEDPAPYEGVMRPLLEHAVECGVDSEYGGIYRDGLRGGQAIILEKEFWQNSESLVGFLDGFDQFGDVKFIEAFHNVWNFAEAHLINHRIGEWRMLAARKGEIIVPDLANEWKVAYHSGRAMLECRKRLERLLGSQD